MTPTDALMGGLISLLSGTLVLLWLHDAERLRLACGIVLGCYLVGVAVYTFATAPRHPSGQRSPSSRPADRVVHLRK